MPIAQDRLINLIAIADGFVTTIDTMHELAAHENMAELYTLANGLMAHVQDPPIRDFIIRLMQTVVVLHDIIDNVQVPHADRDTITAERTHYKKHEKINTYRKHYMRINRSKVKDNLASQEQIPKFFSSTPADYSWPDPTPVSYAPKSRPNRTMDEIVAERTANGTLDPDFRPRTDTIAIADSTDANANDTKPEPKLPTKITGKLRPDVISSSVPSTIEEINAQDALRPGDDVL